MRLRKYGVEATIDFPVFGITGVDLKTDWVPAAADCEVSKDGGVSTQCTNTASAVRPIPSIVLTATEMQAARIVLKMADAATKVFLDTTVIIETYGHASAQHAFDLDTASAAQTADNDTKLTSVLADVTGLNGDAMRGTNGANTVVPDAAGVAPTAVENRQEMDLNSTRLDADMSSRAPASEYDTEMARITANVATEAKQDIIDTNVDTLISNQGDWATATGFATDTELAKVPKSDSNVTWNVTALASIEGEVDNGINNVLGTPTAGSLGDYVKRSKFMLCNRWDITELNGNSDIKDDSGVSFSVVAAAFTTLAGVTLRKKVI